MFKTARHSSSDFWTGYDMFLLFDVLKNEAKKGTNDIDFRAVALVKG